MRSSANIWCFALLFSARIVQGTAAVDFRLPEAARPVRLAGLGDEVSNRRFSWRRRRGFTAGSKYTDKFVRSSKMTQVDRKLSPCSHDCLNLQFTAVQLLGSMYVSGKLPTYPSIIDKPNILPQVRSKC